MIKNWFKNIGPGPLVAAAFIGPGTVTLCTVAGVDFGFALLWTIVLSIVSAIVLQEMSARLGIIAQKGLSENIKSQINHPVIRVLAIVLILFAIVVGNTAYEAGNITGGVLGLETLFGNPEISIGANSLKIIPLVIGASAFMLLYIGSYKVLEKVLITLVVLMSFAFLITAILTKPDLGAVFKGALIPKFPEESLITILGLIGTTVVPYNLFLHASLVKEKWKKKDDLRFARKDTFVAIILGGIVSMCIIISAAAIQSTGGVENAADLARGLEPLFGSFSKYFLAIGLFAAGITSAITAPLAAAYVASGCLGWSSSMKTKKFRAVWMLILIVGVALSSIGINPIEVIQFAQVANGMLLPIVAGFLLWIVNKNVVLGQYKNSITQNILGFLILIVTVFLGAKMIMKVFQLI